MCILIIFFLPQNYCKIFRMKELTYACLTVHAGRVGYCHLRIESWREKANWSASKKAILFTQNGMINAMSIPYQPILIPSRQKLWKKDEKMEMLFVSRIRCVLICTTTTWVVLIPLINFDSTTVPADPLKSGTSTCSGLFSISLLLIPLSFSKKMSKGVEEGP